MDNPYSGKQAEMKQSFNLYVLHRYAKIFQEKYSQKYSASRADSIMERLFEKNNEPQNKESGG